MSPRLAWDAAFSTWGAIATPLDQRVRIGLSRPPSRCGTRGPSVPPWASIPVPTRIRWSGSMASPLEPFRDIRSGRIARHTQKGRCLLAQLIQRPARQARRCRPQPAICLGRRPLETERCSHGHERPAHLERWKPHPPPTPRVVPWEEGRGRRNSRHPRRSRCDPLGPARCSSRRRRADAWRLDCQSA